MEATAIFLVIILVVNGVLFYKGWKWKRAKEREERELKQFRDRLSERVQKSIEKSMCKTMLAVDEDMVDSQIYQHQNLWIPKGEQ